MTATAARGRILPGAAWSALQGILPVHYSGTPQHTEDLFWARLADGTITSSALLADLQVVRSYGFTCIRVMVHANANAFPIGPGAAFSPAKKTALITFLTQAQAAGLSVWLNLFHFYTIFNIADSVTWLNALAAAIPPNLLSVLCCVEVQNELGVTTTATRVPSAQGQGWLRAVVPEVRSLFPRVPVAASFNGFIGGVTGDTTGTYNLKWIIQALGNANALDFYSYHPYVGGAPEAAYAVVNNLRGLLGSTPLVLGEFGLSTRNGSGSFSPDHPQSIAGNENEAEFFTRHMVWLARQHGLPAPLTWLFYDYPGIPDPTSLPVASVSGTGSAFLLTDTPTYEVVWTDSQGHTSAAAAVGAVAAFTGAGQNVVIPPLTVPYGATGVQVYLPQSNGSATYRLYTGPGGTQSGLVGDGVQQTAAVTVTGWGSGIGATNTNTTGADQAGITTSSGGYGYGLYRDGDEPGGAGPKQALTTLQSMWLAGAALDTSFNGDFEKVAIADFAGVVQWPPCWRYKAIAGASAAIALTGGGAQHGGTQCLQLSNFANSTGGALTPFLYTLPFAGNPVNPAALYGLSAWINAVTVPAGVQIVIDLDWLRGDNAGIISSSNLAGVTAPTGGWTQLSFAGTHPPAAAVFYRLVVKMVIPAGLVAAGQIFLDDIVVTAVS